LEGTNGLYEARVQLGSNIWRVFCFFDDGKLVILLNGFQKKTQKTPKTELKKALGLMQKYYTEKNTTQKWKQKAGRK
jgi:phage-related protein